jgi:hypothetical protein
MQVWALGRCFAFALPKFNRRAAALVSGKRLSRLV